MSVTGYAWWLSGRVIEQLLDFWPITLALLVAAYISISRGGLPEEMMEVAKNRVRDINTAYDQIKAARGFK